MPITSEAAVIVLYDDIVRFPFMARRKTSIVAIVFIAIDISSVSIEDMDSVYVARYIIKNAESNTLQPLVVKYNRP